MTTNTAATAPTTCTVCAQPLHAEVNAVTGETQMVADDGWGTVCGDAPDGEHVPAAAPTLAPAVRDAFAGTGWFMAAMWRDGDGVWFVRVLTEGMEDEDEADEEYRAERATLSEAFVEGADGFLLTAPTDDARDNVPADDHERIAKFHRGMVEVMVGALPA